MAKPFPAKPKWKPSGKCTPPSSLDASHLLADGAAPQKGKDWRNTKGQRMGGGGERSDWGDFYQDRGPFLPDTEPVADEDDPVL